MSSTKSQVAAAVERVARFLSVMLQPLYQFNLVGFTVGVALACVFFGLVAAAFVLTSPFGQSRQMEAGYDDGTQ